MGILEGKEGSMVQWIKQVFGAGLLSAFNMQMLILNL